MDETNWSSDFYSYIFSLGFDSLLNTKKCIFLKVVMRSGFRIPIIHVFALEVSLTLINIPRLGFSHLLLTQLIVGNRPSCRTIHGFLPGS